MWDFFMQIYRVKLIVFVGLSFRCAVIESACFETFPLLCHAQWYRSTYLRLVLIYSGLKALMRCPVGNRYVGLILMMSGSWEGASSFWEVQSLHCTKQSVSGSRQSVSASLHGAFTIAKYYLRTSGINEIPQNGFYNKLRELFNCWIEISDCYNYIQFWNFSSFSIY